MNICIVCLDALRVDHVTPARMPHLSALLVTGHRQERVDTIIAATLPSVGAMMFGNDLAFMYGPEDTVRMQTLASRLGQTHSTAAFLGQSTLAVHEAMWLFRDFGHVWSCSDGSWWGPYSMEGVWEQFFAWHSQQSRPWFAYIHLFEVHEPYLPGRVIPSGVVGVEASALADIEEGRFCPVIDSELGWLPIPDKAKQYLRSRYEQYCLETDRKLAAIWPQLLADGETLLIVCSDHGDSHGEDDVWGHGVSAPYQTGVAREVLVAVIPPTPGPAPPRIRSNAQLHKIIAAYVPLGEGNNITEVERRLRGLGYLGG